MALVVCSSVAARYALAHLGDAVGGLAHLPDGVDLLAHVLGQRLHHRGRLLRPADDRLHGLQRRPARSPPRRPRSCPTLLDQPLDLLGGGGAALGELAHLVGHHREAPAVLPGPRGLDGGVQGQQVGLVGDVADHPDDAGDLLGGGGDGPDRLHRLAHRLGSRLRLAHRLARGGAHLLEGLGDLLHGGLHLGHVAGATPPRRPPGSGRGRTPAPREAVSSSTLAAVSSRVEAWLWAPPASCWARRGDLLAGAGHLLGGVHDLAHHLAEPGGHGVEGARQLPELVAALHLHRDAQVAAGDRLGGAHHPGQGPGDHAGDHDADQHPEHQGGRADRRVTLIDSRPVATACSPAAPSSRLFRSSILSR